MVVPDHTEKLSPKGFALHVGVEGGPCHPGLIYVIFALRLLRTDGMRQRKSGWFRRMDLLLVIRGVSTTGGT